MSHKLYIGWKDDPSGSDDYIDLNSYSTATGRGYMLQEPAYSIGQIYIHPEFNVEVLDITIKLNIQGTSVDDVNGLFARLNYFPQVTYSRLQQLRGYLNAAPDGSWHKNKAATLTFLPNNATKTLYWNITNGAAYLPADYLDLNLGSNQINGVTLVLTVMATARGRYCEIDNRFNCGGLEWPFTGVSPFDAGWTLGAGWSVDGSDSNIGYTGPAGRYGNQVLKFVGQASPGTAYTNKVDCFSLLNDKYVIGFSYYLPADPAGKYTIYAEIELENYNSGSPAWQGTAWQTIATIQGTGNTLNQWNDVATAALIPNPTNLISGFRLRLRAVSGTGGALTVYYGGFFAWRNPVDDQKPSEFVSSADTNVIPDIYVYDIQGNVEAPALFRFDPNVTAQRGVIIGGRTADLTVEKPIRALSFQEGDSLPRTTDTGLFWGQQGYDYGFIATPTKRYDLNSGPRFIDTIPRRYVFLLYYAANQDANISKATLSIEGETKVFNESIPQTYTGTTAPASTDYRFWVLGEASFPRQGVFWEDGSGASTGTWSHWVLLECGTTGTPVIRVGGVLAVPSELYASLDMAAVPSPSYVYNISNLASAPRASVSGGSDVTSAKRMMEVTNINTSALLTGGDISLIPGHMAFTALFVRDKGTNTRQLKILPGDKRNIMIRYIPQYRGGVR